MFSSFLSRGTKFRRFHNSAVCVFIYGGNNRNGGNYSFTRIFYFLNFFIWERCPMGHLKITYAHNTAMLAGKDNLCIYIAQLAPHTTFNTKWMWSLEGSRPSHVETFSRSHPETTFQVYKHFDLTGSGTPVA